MFYKKNRRPVKGGGFYLHPVFCYYLVPNTSISNFSMAFGGITPPAPVLPVSQFGRKYHGSF